MKPKWVKNYIWINPKNKILDSSTYLWETQVKKNLMWAVRFLKNQGFFSSQDPTIVDILLFKLAKH